MIDTAHLLLVNDAREVLVLKCSEWSERPDRSLGPDLPGGMVDLNESVHEGMLRELHEESGLRLEPSDLEIVYARTEHDVKDQVSLNKHVFVAQCTGRPEVTISWEHSDYKWVPVEELMEIEWRPFHREPIDFILARGLLT